VIALFSISTGSRSVCCLSSMLAAATVLHVIKEVEPCHALDYENELMDVLNLNLSRVCMLFSWIFVLPYNDVLYFDTVDVNPLADLLNISMFDVFDRTKSMICLN